MAGALSSHVLLCERNRYPATVALDFSKLRLDALRKYMVCQGIPEVPGGSKEQLVGIVARHFNEECKKADESSALASFVTYLTGSNDTVEAAKLLQAQPFYRFNGISEDYTDVMENECRQRPNDNPDSVHTLRADDLHCEVLDDSQEYAGWDRKRHSMSFHPRLVKSAIKLHQRTHGKESKRSEAEVLQMKKKRKGRLYCVCKGTSFGNMIACDNQNCLDRSNWYHMDCVDLDPFHEAPEIWFCPACQENNCRDIPENHYRKPVASATYGDMISHALTVLPGGKGSFQEICHFVETEYKSQLNWKLESDQRKSPVWKSSVRKILFSNVRFQKHAMIKGLFCLAT